MRKFTFLLLLMFSLVGTLMAQDAAPVAFELSSSNPAIGAQVSKVEIIQLGFTNDISVTMPEEPIVIKNNDTNVEFKIVNAMAYGMDAVFYLQKVGDETVTSIKGVDDDGNVNNDFLGDYTWTLPAGCIKNFEGVDFGEKEFSFTIVKPLTIVSTNLTNSTLTNLDKIEITFDQEIAEVKMPNYGLSVVNWMWSPVANVTGATISDDKMTVVFALDKAVTTPGTYNFDLYNNVIVSVSGLGNDWASLSCTVVDLTPDFITNIENGSRVKELGNTLEITFKNVKEVKPVDGAEDVIVFTPGEGEATGEAEFVDNKIVVTFDQDFTLDGDYVFSIPAGMFTMDGVENEARDLTVTLYTFVITPLEIVSVTPVEGTVNQLDKIVIEFNQPVTLSYDENWQQISREIKLMCGETEYILTNLSSWNVSNTIEYITNAEWNGYEYAATPIIDEATYTLDLSQVVVDHAVEDGIDEAGWPVKVWHSKNVSCTGEVSWTIVKGETGINGVEAEESEQVIYDITGRIVKGALKAGVYIINGKKTIIE